MAKNKKEKRYVERDVSWMYFNHRILQEAQKENIPLLERLSFLGIYSNNLDEFFRVRMASLSRLLESDNKEVRRQHDTIRKTMAKINKLNSAYSQEYTSAIDHVFDCLEKHNIRMLDETQLNDEQKRFLTNFFHERLNGYTNPIWYSEIGEIGQLEDNRIYLLVRKTDITSGSSRPKSSLAIIKVPDRENGRFIKLPFCATARQERQQLPDVPGRCHPILPSDHLQRTELRPLRSVCLQVYEGCRDGDGQRLRLRRA